MHCNINIKSVPLCLHSASAKTVHVAVDQKGGGVNLCPALLVMSSVLSFFFLSFCSISYLFCVLLGYILYSLCRHSHLLSFSLPLFCLHYFFSLLLSHDIFFLSFFHFPLFYYLPFLLAVFFIIFWLFSTPFLPSIYPSFLLYFLLSL